MAADAQTVKIGIDLPLSGADSTDGVPTPTAPCWPSKRPTKWGSPAATTRSQGRHPRRRRAGQARPGAGRPERQDLHRRSVVLGMVGPFNSNVAKSEIPLTNDAGLVQISPSNTNDGLTRGRCGQAAHRAPRRQRLFPRLHDRLAPRRRGRRVRQEARLQKGLHHRRQRDVRKGLADVFEAQFKDGGGTVLGHEHITPNQQDFTALLTKARSLGPDVVFYGGTTSTGGGLVRKQMGNVGMSNVAYMGGDGITDEEFLKVAGALANGRITRSPPPKSRSSPAPNSSSPPTKSGGRADPALTAPTPTLPPK